MIKRFILYFLKPYPIKTRIETGVNMAQPIIDVDFKTISNKNKD
jgi:hypothetical protein